MHSLTTRTPATQRKPRNLCLIKIWADKKSILNGAKNPPNMILPVQADLLLKEDLTSGTVTLDASTVIEEAISKGTAKKDPEEMIGRETDIGMTGEGDQEVEIDHHADLPEMTLDLRTEAESSEITETQEVDMVTGTTIDARIVMTEEAEVEIEGVDVIEDGITLATRMKDPTTTDLGLDLPQEKEGADGIDLPRDLTDPTTEEIDPSKKEATLLFTTRNCRITTNNLKTTKTENSKLNKSILSKTEKFQRELKMLQLSKKLMLINPQLARPKTSEVAASRSL